MKVYKIRHVGTGKFARRTGFSYSKTGHSWTSLKRCARVFKDMCQSEANRDFLEIVQFSLIESGDLGHEDLLHQVQDSYQSMHNKEWYSKVDFKEDYEKTLKNFHKD